MFKNCLQILKRTLWKNKAFTAINVSGLAIGIATCVIILLFVQDELSYDRFNEKAGQIVRVVFRGSVQGEKMKEASVMPPVAQTFEKDYPEVLGATRLRNFGYPRVTYGEKLLRNNSFAFADSNFFSVFTLPFVEGDPKTALLEPNTLVISETAAKKFFGQEEAVGKVLNFKDQSLQFKITGVMKDIPANSHFHFDLFGAMTGFPPSREQSWMTSEYYTYLVLPKGYDYKKLEAKLPRAVEKYMGPQLQTAFGMTMSQFRQKGNDLGLFLQPLTDIHLRSDLNLELEAGSDVRFVYIFTVIAIFMLVVACINFMNLSTASASKRAREVGIRKVLGSEKKELIWQFLLESLALTAIALVIALFLVYLGLPLLNHLSGKKLSLNFGEHPWILPSLLLIGLLTGLFAGSYPAFFLSSFQPIAVLKGRVSSGKKTIGLRSGLVVFQFFISILLIVGSIVVYRQLSFIRHKKLGYDKNQVVLVEESYWLGKNRDAFMQKLREDPRIQSVSSSSYIPAGYSNNNNFILYPDNNSSQFVHTLRYDVDYDYIPTLGMQMKSGRNFSRDFGTDSAAIIINEQTAKAFGWEKTPIGHLLTKSENDGTKKTYHVVGVVNDFHFRSLHEHIAPLVMVLSNEGGDIIVKTKTRDLEGLLSSLKKGWTDFKAEAPFSYSFLDERFNNTYKAEQKVGLILGIFAALTIFVAALGLFGLASFTAEQRTKEIGIRKVLGASVSGIVKLLSGDFLKLVLIAFVVAVPVAWFAMNRWLQDFVYRTEMAWWIFAAAAGLAIVVTLFTISFQAIKAARSNPVKSIRTE